MKIITPIKLESMGTYDEDDEYGLMPMDISEEDVIHQENSQTSQIPTTKVKNQNYTTTKEVWVNSGTGLGLDPSEFECTEDIVGNIGNIDHPVDISQRKFVHARRNNVTTTTTANQFVIPDHQQYQAYKHRQQQLHKLQQNKEHIEQSTKSLLDNWTK